ncbi:MAG: CBS domain-containing protein, partial [Pseudomonadota bacterium]
MAAGSDDGSRQRIRDWFRSTLRLKAPSGADAVSRLSEFLDTEALIGEARSTDERALLENVLRLRDLRVYDVMVPRADIIAIEAGATLEETVEAFREGAHSRLPVYRDALDDPIGVVHLKDVALSYGFQSMTASFDLRDHMRELLVVPPSMRVPTLLQRMRATRRHMALVIDE